MEVIAENSHVSYDVHIVLGKSKKDFSSLSNRPDIDI